MHKIARIYLRVSTDEQDLSRQERIVEDARAAGYYVAGVYREKASGANMNRSELQRMIADLQPDDVIIAERIDRLSRLPLPEAQALIDTIRKKGARLAIPGVVDLSQFAEHTDGIAKIFADRPSVGGRDFVWLKNRRALKQRHAGRHKKQEACEKACDEIRALY